METKEKVYCITGLEFGAERQGQVILIWKALYGLASSAACFHTYFADTLRSFRFRTTRFDQDVWIKFNKTTKHYDYIYNHVDDFCIFSKNPQLIMDQIKSIFTIKSEGPPYITFVMIIRKMRKIAGTLDVKPTSRRVLPESRNSLAVLCPSTILR